MLAVLVVVGGIFFYTMKSPKQTDSPLSPTVSGASSAGAAKQKLIEQGDEIVKMLNFVKDINLETDLFNDPLFLSLSDFSVSLPRKEIGKNNPFSSLEK